MARWREKKQAVRFEDVPAVLTGRAQAEWLEARGLSFVDYLDWKRDQDPLAKLRPPSRRKLMSAKQRAALDAQREREGAPPW
jgi:hypothetical protein